MGTTDNNTVTDPDVNVTQTASGGETAAATKDTTAVKDTAAAKTYDQAYIDKLLADQEAARKAAVEEALKVAKMDEASKATYEKDKEDQALKEREAKIALRERKADALDYLGKNDIPKEFLDMLVGKDMDETKENVAAFKTQFDAAVQAQVEKRLAGRTPSGGNGSTQKTDAETMAAEIAKYMN